MDLENFAKKFDVDVKVLEKELNEIVKKDSCSMQAALNEWKRINFDKLAMVKKGKTLVGLYLFTESVPSFRRNDGTEVEAYHRIFYLVLPTVEDTPPVIAFLKIGKDKIYELYKAEPKAFTAYEFDNAFVVKGERLNYIRSSKDENDLPLVSVKEDLVYDNKELHEYFIHCAKRAELWYDDLQEKEVEYRNNLFCYLQVTGVGTPFKWTDKNTGEEHTCKIYYLADNVDETSMLRIIFRDWRSQLTDFEKYDNIFFYGGYAKQNLENEDQLELGWSEYSNLYLAMCPTPY